jgi:hypothetical protein
MATTCAAWFNAQFGQQLRISLAWLDITQYPMPVGMDTTRSAGKP